MVAMKPNRGAVGVVQDLHVVVNLVRREMRAMLFVLAPMLMAPTRR